MFHLLNVRSWGWRGGGGAGSALLLRVVILVKRSLLNTFLCLVIRNFDPALLMRKSSPLWFREYFTAILVINAVASSVVAEGKKSCLLCRIGSF